MNRRLVLKTICASLAGFVQSCLVGSRQSKSQTSDLGLKEWLRLRLTKNLSDVVSAWFPRSLDTAHGGFLCDFDFDWRPNGPQQKRLEFQARQVRAAAHAAIFDRGYRQAYDAAEHGFRYLTETMWDREYGGWFYMLHRNGAPIYKEKHAHGVAYAIEACIAHHQLTGRADGVEVAKAAFRWLDSHAHDAANGGYYSYLKQDGTPIVAPPSRGIPIDPLGTRIGLKDCNTTLDLVEAFSGLFAATADLHVGGRLNELLLIVKNAMLRPPGIMCRSYTPDWKPADNLSEIGVMLQGSCALMEASKLVSIELRGDINAIARTIVDTCLRDVWDDGDAAFGYEGIIDERTLAVRDRTKAWWVQAEGMRALLRMAISDSAKANEYFGRCLRLWSFIDLKLVDHAHLGWHQTASSKFGAKAHMWKDASHEVRALSECIRLLQGAK
jgi:mannobiose 2-epimerase